MSELEEFKKVVSPIAYGLAYKSELGTTEYQQLYAEEDVIKYFNNKPQLTIPKSIAERLDKEGSYDSAFVYPRTWELEVQGTLESCRRINVQKIYLISKALGVDLVKVVEG